MESATKAQPPDSNLSRVWWSNGIFFVAVHIAAAIGVFCYPWHSVPRATLVLCLVLWQSAMFGITIGYHRLYSHRAFRASFGVRLFLALLGASASQGSIKWWCLRHRLHHRFTDDPKHDPYAATRGLLWAHMGWIFFKTHYERLALIDGDDLDRDIVARLQHRYYVPLALILGFVLPPTIATIWGDPIRGFVWASLVSRILIWHSTFLINSLAHWDGLQPYTDENTSRTNLILALFTGGEGNHNFHAFPHDYRSGPSQLDWDPSKWIIFLLHTFGLVTSLRRARDEDMHSAQLYMNLRQNEEKTDAADSQMEAEDAPWEGPTWTQAQVWDYALAVRPGSAKRCVVIVDGYVVDITTYLGNHPGGAALLRKYSMRADTGCGHDTDLWEQAEWAFHGGLNKHSRAATRRMRELRLARFSPNERE